MILFYSATMATAAVLEDVITCCICFKVYSDPYALACLHTLCRSCIDLLEVRGRVECPECRETADIKAIRRDFKTQTLIDDQTQKDAIAKNTNFQCGMCYDPNERVASHCTECDLFLCVRCEQGHKRIKICVDHIVKPLTEIIKIAKSKLLDGVNQWQKEKSEMSEKCNSIVDCIKCVHDQQEKGIEKTNQHFDKLINTLETKRAAHIKEIKALNLVTLQNLNKNKQVYDQILKEIQSNIEMLQEVIGKEDIKTMSEMGLDIDVCILQRTLDIRQQVCDLSAEIVTSIEVIVRSNLHLDPGIHLRKVGKKDTNKPKRRRSAYIYFRQTCREDEKKRNPGATIGFVEFSKNCLKQWKGMTANDKKRFDDMAKDDKIRYDKEMVNYVPTDNIVIKRKANDLNAPKLSESAFFFFCNEFKGGITQANPDYGIGDVTKALEQKWQLQTNRSKYFNLAKTDKERYEKEMAAYTIAGASSSKKSKDPPKEKIVEVKKEEEDDANVDISLSSSSSSKEEEEEEDDDDDDEKEITLSSSSPSSSSSD